MLISGFAPIGRLDLSNNSNPVRRQTPVTGGDSDIFQKSSLLEVLTTDDLKLIEMTPGGEKLAACIGRDRSSGTLSGPVNRDYFESVINRQIEDLDAAEPEVPYVVLHNAEREASILNGDQYPPPRLKETDIPGVYAADGEVGNVICIREVLTNSDKKLLMNINGGTLKGGSDDFTQLMTTIALDRSIGNLKGDMSREYLRNLISQAKRDISINPKQSPTVSVGFLEDALAAYDAMHTNESDRTTAQSSD